MSVSERLAVVEERQVSMDKRLSAQEVRGDDLRATVARWGGAILVLGAVAERIWPAIQKTLLR